MSAAAYLAFWNSFVSQARAIDPSARFGGPADYTNQGSQCAYYPNGESACFLPKALTGMAQSGVLPDFVTYHWYPCWEATASERHAKASGFSAAAQQVLTWTKQAFPGKSIPVGISEWNADPGNPSYMNDGAWMAQFVTDALSACARAAWPSRWSTMSRVSLTGEPTTCSMSTTMARPKRSSPRSRG